MLARNDINFQESL
jgi:hypothetical protein